MVSLAAPLFAETVQERLGTAADVFSEVMDVPDNAIPQELLTKAHCAVVVPGLKKAAFVFGGKFGRGFVTCRKLSGPGWGAPGAIRVEGGSFGLQIGGSSSDVVLLVMNKRGMDKLLSSQFTIGGDASAAAGPVGRNASANTDALMHAEILSWSRSRGVFAGVSLEGATLRQDEDANREMYGRQLENNEIVMKGIAPPKGAERLLSLLGKHSAREVK